MNTKQLKERLQSLHIEMYLVSKDMENFGDDETKEKSKELLNASLMIREWAEDVKEKI